MGFIIKSKHISNSDTQKSLQSPVIVTLLHYNTTFYTFFCFLYFGIENNKQITSYTCLIHYKVLPDSFFCFVLFIFFTFFFSLGGSHCRHCLYMLYKNSFFLFLFFDDGIQTFPFPLCFTAAYLLKLTNIIQVSLWSCFFSFFSFCQMDANNAEENAVPCSICPFPLFCIR